MTPEDEQALLKKAAAEVEKAAKKAYDQVIQDIRAGESPQAAIQKAIANFNGEFTELFTAWLGVLIGESIGDPIEVTVGAIQLSSKLYANSAETSQVVEGVVRRHTQGFQDARALALDLYEGYDFRPEEVLEVKSTNTSLPKDLRELVKDARTGRELNTAFARAQAKALKTGPLRAAYTELVDAIDNVETGAGQAALEKKLDVALHEKLRYYANRIAQTELHRAYANAQAMEILLDTDIEYVQWRLNPAHPVEDICDYFAQVDHYGLGPGVYPKMNAPVAPAHPHCKCVMSPRLDLSGRVAKPQANADQRYFRKLPSDDRRKVAGSAKKLDEIMAGKSAMDVHNAGTDPLYQVKTVGEVAAGKFPGQKAA